MLQSKDYGADGVIEHDFALAVQESGDVVIGATLDYTDASIPIIFKNSPSLVHIFGEVVFLARDYSEPGAQDEILVSVEVDKMGRILVLGRREVAGVSETVLARVTPEGMVDNYFGEEGLVEFPSGYEGMDVALQGNNPVVLLRVTDNAGIKLFQVMRLLGEGDAIFRDGFDTD